MNIEDFNKTPEAVSTLTYPTPRSVRVYALGGAGINNGAALAKLFDVEMEKSHSSFYAKPDICFIDGSRQNLSKVPDNRINDVFVMRRMDETVDRIKYPEGIELSGGGGDRAYINKVAIDNTPLIINKFKPSKVLNVLIFSAAGASGATQGQHLFKELVKQGYPVIVVLISVNASASRVMNTNKTLVSLINYQRSAKVAAGLFEVNNAGLSVAAEAATDEKISMFLLQLLAVYSNTASRLDEKDCLNWLDYYRVTKTEPELLRVDAVNAVSIGEVVGEVTSVIGIVRPTTEVSPAVENVLNNALYVKLGVVEHPEAPISECYLVAHPIDLTMVQAIDSHLDESNAQIAAHATGRERFNNALSRWNNGSDEDGGMI